MTRFQAIGYEYVRPTFGTPRLQHSPKRHESHNVNDTIQQLLNAGLVDELSIDIAAMCLGSGVRLFENLEDTPTELGNPEVIPGVGVTHLRYPVLHNG